MLAIFSIIMMIVDKHRRGAVLCNDCKETTELTISYQNCRCSRCSRCSSLPGYSRVVATFLASLDHGGFNVGSRLDLTLSWFVFRMRSIFYCRLAMSDLDEKQRAGGGEGWLTFKLTTSSWSSCRKTTQFLLAGSLSIGG